MDSPIIDLRNRPALLHDFYGRTPGSPAAATARFLNERMGSADPDQFARSRTLDGWLAQIGEAGITTAVVVGRHTPGIAHDNDEIAALVAKDKRLVGVGSIDPARGADMVISETFRAVAKLGLRAINVEPGFLSPAKAIDDPSLWPLYAAVADLDVPLTLMTGPTTPDLRLNDPSAIAAVARAFPRLQIVVYHGCWPRVAEIVGVALLCPNVTVVPDMYIVQPGGRLYVEAANGALARQIAFGTAYPFRDMAQTVADYRTLGFRDDVLPLVMGGNARRLLQLP
jgi:uncharacterized protein